MTLRPTPDPDPTRAPCLPAGLTRFSETDPAPAGPEGALVLLHDGLGRIVLQLRDDRPDIPNPGRWSLFGGGVEPGETRTQAAVREWAEETGLSINPARLRPFVRVATGPPRHAHLHVIAHDGAVPGLTPGVLALGEGAGFGFFTPAQVAGLDLAPVLKPVLMYYLDVFATELSGLAV